jgi:hypothetical protein
LRKQETGDSPRAVGWQESGDSPRAMARIRGQSPRNKYDDRLSRGFFQNSLGNCLTDLDRFASIRCVHVRERQSRI